MKMKTIQKKMNGGKIMSDELVDYVIEFIADNEEVFRILVKQRMGLETHIYALKRAAQFIIENDIVLSILFRDLPLQLHSPLQ